MKATFAICLLILFVYACAPKEQYAPFKIVPAETPSTNGETEPGPEPLPSQGSGVKGQVLIGPACPVMRVEDPCPDQPYQAKITVYSLNGQEVTRFETDKDGKFAVNLPPGDYILHPKSPDGRPIPSAEDVEFTVLPNEFTEVIVNFDSGIR
jgi:Prealbumin-like fold domain